MKPINWLLGACVLFGSEFGIADAACIKSGATMDAVAATAKPDCAPLDNPPPPPPGFVYVGIESIEGNLFHHYVSVDQTEHYFRQVS